MNAETSRLMKVSDLHFDRKNPRLAEFNLTDDSEESEVMEILWEAMDVEELTMSIAASGFFRHEPVLVAEEYGRHAVIEGNRRLAAVKLLLDPDLVSGLASRIPAIEKTSKERRLMFKWPAPPSVHAPKHEIADFAELVAWQKGCLSITSPSKLFGRNAENDYSHGAPEEDAANGVVEEAYMEIKQRQDACGGGYPFEIIGNGYALRIRSDRAGDGGVSLAGLTGKQPGEGGAEGL